MNIKGVDFIEVDNDTGIVCPENVSHPTNLDELLDCVRYAVETGTRTIQINIAYKEDE